MTKGTHNLYIGSMIAIVLITLFFLSYQGYTYYSTSLEERFYHEQHDWLKPSGLFGQGLGIIGTFLILFGVSIYIARKRYNFMSKLLRLKYLLEFHIFLCTLGPIMILFHTAFKFGGIVSIAFWSMVAVVLSGVLGRFIYIQIPRTIEGRELTLSEVQQLRLEAIEKIKHNTALEREKVQQILDISTNFSNSEKLSFYQQYFNNRLVIRQVRQHLRNMDINKLEQSGIIRSVKEEISLSNKISRLNKMQQLFKYWHVAHMPFAIIMLIIVVIHICISFAFGYKWIF